MPSDCRPRRNHRRAPGLHSLQRDADKVRPLSAYLEANGYAAWLGNRPIPLLPALDPIPRTVGVANLTDRSVHPGVLNPRVDAFFLRARHNEPRRSNPCGAHIQLATNLRCPRRN